MAEPEALFNADLSRLLPHAGRMCLLAGIVSWDAETIECVAMSHRDPANPLRRNGRLHGVHAIEYAAQAMAVHGSLVNGGGGRPGMLVSARRVRWLAARLDDRPAPLTVHCRRLGGSAEGVVYDFEVRDEGGSLANGRAMVAFVDHTGSAS